MNLWNSQEDLFTLIRRELFTCVVGDVMDKLGLQHQFLPPQIQPLRQDMVVVGRAMPVLSVDVENEVFTRTVEKARDEKLVKRAIEAGMSAVEAFEKYGIM